MTAENSAQKNQIPLAELFSSAVDLYKENIPLFLCISIAANLPFLVIESLKAVNVPELTAVASLFSPLVIAILVLFLMALIFAIRERSAERDMPFGTALSYAWDKIIPGFLVYIAFSLLIVAAALCLLLPAFYCITVFYFSPMSVLLENKSVWEGFRRSKELTAGLFWKILGTHAVIFLLLTVVLLPLTIGFNWLGVDPVATVLVRGVINIFFMPLVTAFYYFLFLDLKKKKDQVLKISVYSQS